VKTIHFTFEDKELAEIISLSLEKTLKEYNLKLSEIHEDKCIFIPH